MRPMRWCRGWRRFSARRSTAHRRSEQWQLGWFSWFRGGVGWLSRPGAGVGLWTGAGQVGLLFGAGSARLVSSKRRWKERTVELGGPPEELSDRIRVAGSGRASPEMMAALVDDPHPVVRRTVATSNVVTPADLERLVKDPDPSVRQAAASNPKTPGRALAQLADDPDPAVRSTAAAHPAMPDSLRKNILRS